MPSWLTRAEQPTSYLGDEIVRARMTDYDKIPDFDTLPAIKDMPQGCAWGVLDSDGRKDYLGTLNLLTWKMRLEATKVRNSSSVSLN